MLQSTASKYALPQGENSERLTLYASKIQNFPSFTLSIKVKNSLTNWKHNNRKRDKSASKLAKLNKRTDLKISLELYSCQAERIKTDANNTLPINEAIAIFQTKTDRRVWVFLSVKKNIGGRLNLTRLCNIKSRPSIKGRRF